MESKQTKLFEEKQVFFAFSNEQFKEGMQKHNINKDNTITSLGGGMYCPKYNAQEVVDTLHKIYTDSINKDIEENGKDKIILRELCNYEAFYVGDIEDTKEKLKDYKCIEEKDIIRVYHKNYSKHADGFAIN